MTTIRENSEAQTSKLEARRAFLKVAGTGVPLVLTMRASGAQAVHSSLTCTVTVPAGLLILVSEDGAAWVTDRVSWRSGRELNRGRVRQIQENADYIFPDGSVPTEYRPEGDDDDYDDDDDDRDDDDRRQGVDSAPNGNGPDGNGPPGNGPDGNGPPGSDQPGNNNGRNNQRDDDDDDDDSDESIRRRFAVFYFPQNTSFAPGDFINGDLGSGSSDEENLYFALAKRYSDFYGNSGDFPGISCIASVLTYMETRS